MEAVAILPAALPIKETVLESATASQPRVMNSAGRSKCSETTSMPDQGPGELAHQQQAAIEKLRAEQKVQLEKLEREQRAQLELLIKTSKVGLSCNPFSHIIDTVCQASRGSPSSQAVSIKMEELLISDKQRDSGDNTGPIRVKQEHEHCGRVRIKRENEHVNGSSRKFRKMGTEKVPIVVGDD